MSLSSLSFALRFEIVLPMLCLFIRVGVGHAQISPGELASAHNALEGISNCARCHETKGKLSGELCLDCHGEIRVQFEEKKGYHWKTVGGSKRTKCGRCHAEHNGREYDLIYWGDGIDRFDHGQTDYPLEGRHGEKRCRDCHRREYIARDLKSLNPEIDPDRTFLGLRPACGGCHRDIHRGQFDQACETCHGMEAWKPAERFMHERSDYPLTGRHASVSCEKCHREADGSKASEDTTRSVRYKDLPFDDCSDCHAYRHRSEFGNSCRECHTTEGWRIFDREGFDHGRTRFVLRGRHGTVPCESCHREGTRGAALKFDRCVDCHRDIHLSGFRSDRYAGKCEACHNEDRFVPSTFGLEEHDRGPFPLKGAHRAVPCGACHKHPEGQEQISFRIESKECESCHRDPHRGQFNRERYPGCTSCHGPDRWDHLRFDHQETAFPLDGRHVDVRCGACHPEVETIDGERFIRYNPLDRRCRGCHVGVPELSDNDNDKDPFDRGGGGE